MSESERIESKILQGEKLTPAQERAVAALLASSTLEEAARAARTSVATLRRWRQQEAFQQAWRTERTALLEGATAKLRRASGKAVDTLTTLLDSDKPEVRLRAAQAILTMAYKSAEVEELSERVEELDAAVSEWSEQIAQVRR